MGTPPEAGPAVVPTVPVKLGGRFSRKAVNPSRKSSAGGCLLELRFQLELLLERRLWACSKSRFVIADCPGR